MEDDAPVTGSFKLQRDAWGKLVLTDQAGTRYEGVEVVRAFPIADPQHGISICDGQGRELVHLWETGDTPAEVWGIIEAELCQREFVPVIQRILNNPPDTEPTEWQVETDRGVTTIQLETGNDLHRSGPNQVTVVDAHGIRYLIPDRARLDSHSRQVLDRFL